MRCFFHHERDAIALGFWCNRGLCPACAAEVSDRLACRGRCEADVGRAIRLSRASSSLVEGAERSRRLNRVAGFGLAGFVTAFGGILSV